MEKILVKHLAQYLGAKHRTLYRFMKQLHIGKVKIITLQQAAKIIKAYRHYKSLNPQLRSKTDYSSLASSTEIIPGCFKKPNFQKY